MAIYEITLSVPVTKDATAAQVEEWLKFHFHYSSSISGDNPLIDLEPQTRAILAFRLSK